MRRETAVRRLRTIADPGLQALLERLDRFTAFQIPRQRGSAERAALRYTGCPNWCRGHDSSTYRVHESETIEVRAAGDTFPADHLTVCIRAEAGNEPTARWLDVDGHTMTPEQARDFATALAIAAGVADPAHFGAEPHTIDTQALAYVVRAEHQGAEHAYAWAARSLSDIPATILAGQLATNALQLKAISQASRLAVPDSSTPFQRQVSRCLDACVENLRRLAADLQTGDKASLTLAQLLCRPDTDDRASSARQHQRDLCDVRPADALPDQSEYVTDASCQPWCVYDDPRHCGGHCLSDQDHIAASAAGGRFQDDGMRFPAVEVYTAISSPHGLRSVHLVPYGPCGKGEVNGWVELLPSEAYKLADYLRRHADRASGKLP